MPLLNEIMLIVKHTVSAQWLIVTCKTIFAFKQNKIRFLETMIFYEEFETFKFSVMFCMIYLKISLCSVYVQ